MKTVIFYYSFKLFYIFQRTWITISEFSSAIEYKTNIKLKAFIILVFGNYLKKVNSVQIRANKNVLKNCD